MKDYKKCVRLNVTIAKIDTIVVCSHYTSGGGVRPGKLAVVFVVQMAPFA